MPRLFQTTIWVPGAEHIVWFSDAGASEAQWKEFLDNNFSYEAGYEWIVHRFTLNNKDYLKLQHNNGTLGEFEVEIVVPLGQGFSIQFDGLGKLLKTCVYGQAYTGGNGMHSAVTNDYTTHI